MGDSVPEMSPEAFDHLVPFHVHWDSEGRLTRMSGALRKYWHQPSPEELDSILLIRPFKTALELKWFPEITDMVLSATHVCCHCGDHTLRGELMDLGPHGWMLVGRPEVSRVVDLVHLGLTLSDLPLHVGLGDLLIANEAAQISLTETEQVASRLRELNAQLSGINKAFGRFVPQPYLETLGLDSPTEAELGTHVGVYKTVMFADLRNFTTLSERMASAEIFDFINEYLAHVAPAIRDHGGFVLHYLGDGIMAIFPEDPTQAVHAAIAMQAALRAWSETIDLGPDFELRVGVGLHYGHLALGIVGEGDRWDSSVISDSVNTAARVEGLTKTFGADLLITESVAEKLIDPEQFALRRIGSIGVKGKAKQVVIYEVLDSLDDKARASRERISEPFRAGVNAFEANNPLEAHALFATCLEMSPDDLTVRYYRDLLKGVTRPRRGRRTSTPTIC